MIETTIAESENIITPETRLRRLRQKPALRRLVRETALSIDNFVLPLFIHHGKNVKNPISSMPGQYQISVDNLASEVESISQLNIPAVSADDVSDTWQGLLQISDSCDAVNVVSLSIIILFI